MGKFRQSTVDAWLNNYNWLWEKPKKSTDALPVPKKTTVKRKPTTNKRKKDT